MKIISSLYAGGTRGARVLNAAVALIWSLGTLVGYYGWLNIEIPGFTHPLGLLFLASTTFIISILSLVVTKFRETLKYLSLHLGALLNTLIAAYFATQIPIAMTSITSALFAIWLLGAAYFAMECCQDLKNKGTKNV